MTRVYTLPGGETKQGHEPCTIERTYTRVTTTHWSEQVEVEAEQIIPASDAVIDADTGEVIEPAVPEQIIPARYETIAHIGGATEDVTEAVQHPPGWLAAASADELAALGITVEDVVAPVAVITEHDVSVAKQRVAAFADELAAQVTGPVPEAERASWGSKELAARAYLDGVAPGTATATQVAMLQAEAGLTGETVAALAQKVVVNADAYVVIAAMIAGQRRMTALAIDALEIGVATVVDLDDVMMAARAQAEAALQQILSGMA